MRIPRAHHILALLIATACSDGSPASLGPLATPTGNPRAAANVAPDAVFAVSPRWPLPGDTVTFDATYAFDRDGRIVAYTWDLGNGVTQVSGPVARTVYRDAGSFTVKLTAQDDSGATTSRSLSLIVSSAGAPTTAVSASQSSFTLGASSTNATVSVAATITTRNAAGQVLSGIPVVLGSNGYALAIAQPPRPTDAAGVATGTIASTAAQQTTLRAIADFTLLNATAGLSVTPGAASGTLSTIRLTDPVLAAGDDSTLVEVTARDGNGNAISGATVALYISGGSATVNNAGATDANGRRVLSVIPTTCGKPLTVRGMVNGVAITPSATVTRSAIAAYGACNVALWLDASAFVSFTLENGSRITQWRDQSGNANHATAAAGTTARPTYNSLGYFGRPSVDFVGGASTTATPEYLNLARYPLTGAAAGTILVVWTHSATNTCERLFDFNAGPTSTYYLSPDCSGGRHRVAITTSATTGEVTADAGTAGTALSVPILSTVTHGGALALRVNAVQRASITTTLAPKVIGTPGNNWLGRSATTTHGYFSGSLAEVLVFSRVLTTQELQTVEQALLVKWGGGSLRINAGNEQKASAGTSPSVAPEACLTDDAGNGLAGAQITWQIARGGGRFGSAATTTSTTTDAKGCTSVPIDGEKAWTLDAGVNQLRAWLSSMAGYGQSIDFTATGTLPSGLIARYDADVEDNFTLDPKTGRISQWRDVSGNGLHVVQDQAEYQPTRVAKAINGRAAAQFAKSNSLAFTNDKPSTQTMIAVVSTVDRKEGFHKLLAMPADGDLGVRATNTCYAYSAKIGCDIDIEDYDWAFGTGSPPAVWVNGVQPSKSPMFQAGTPHIVAQQSEKARADTYSLGSTDPERSLIGLMPEVLLFSRELKDSERAQIERYLAWKWAIKLP